jgi:hypothetical protein
MKCAPALRHPPQLHGVNQSVRFITTPRNAAKGRVQARYPLIRHTELARQTYPALNARIRR